MTTTMSVAPARGSRIDEPRRTVPLLVRPLPGEPFDSWLMTYAHRIGLPVGELLSALGLRPSSAMAEYTIRLHPDEATQTARVTGLSTTQLDAMTLRTFDGRMVVLEANQRAVTRSVWWGRGSGSRFCPQCLTERDGRWLLRWRLSWAFACARHNSLLHDRCPRCRGTVRQSLLKVRWDRPPAYCDGVVAGAPCRADLRTVPPQPLSVDYPILRAQHWIDGLIDAVEQGKDGDDPSTSLAQRCSDLRAVGGWLLRQGAATDFDHFGEHVVQAWHAAQARYREDNIRPSQFPPTDAALMGALIARIQALITGTDDSAVAEIRRLLIRTPQRPSVCPPGLDQQWHRLSPAVQALFLRAGDPDRSYVDRLRHRSCCPTARLPESDGSPVNTRSSHLPQLLWPGWTVRLLPVQGRHIDAFRAVMAICLLIPGDGRRPVSRTAAHLHPYISTSMISSVLLRLAQQGHDSVFPALCELADNLDRHGSPIDYARRRGLITPEVLTERDWHQICYTTRTHPGHGRRFRNARRYLLQRLTGCDFTDPTNPLTFTDTHDRAWFTEFTSTLPTIVCDALHEHAAGHLRTLGIDEPVTWEPPRGWAPSLVPPGREPSDIDLTALRHMIVDQGMTARDAAARLGTNIQHVRLVLEDIEHVDSPPGAARPAEARDRRQHARTILTPEFLEREYVQNGQSLQRIASATGIPQDIVVEIAKDAGHVVTRGPRRIVIDERWLREQYLVKRRSFPDIAAECGASEKTVTRCAREYGIPARPAGITSHPHMVTKANTALHPDIRRAVEGGLHGWQRLHRFRAVMAFPTIKTAAVDLGIHPSTLINQLQRIEDDIGAQLYIRATPHRPLRITRRGTALLRALDRPEAQRYLAIASTAGTSASAQPPRKRRTPAVVNYGGKTRQRPPK